MTTVAPALDNLARAIGVSLSDRHAEGGFVYDGASIALRRNARRTYSTHEVLHEVCHWIVADDVQREFPEFGLMLGIADAAANGSKFYSDKDYYLISEGLIDMQEQTRQEVVVQRLCCYIGRRLSLSPAMPDREFRGLKSWEFYENWKRADTLRIKGSPDWDSPCITRAFMDHVHFLQEVLQQARS